MASEARRAAAVRQRSAAHRVRELQERIDRLRAGEPTTPQDVDRARASAEAQRGASDLARRRLVAARTMVEERHRRAAVLRASTPRPQGPPWISGPEGCRPGTTPYERVRDAFVSLCLQSVPTHTLAEDERRRSLASEVVDRATGWSPASWPTALCEVARRLPGVRGVALSTYGGTGTPHPLGASDDWSRHAEELQQVLGEGPGLTAHLTRRPVVVTRLAAESERWPGYVAATSGIGVDVLWALPILLGSSSVGSVTFHRHDDRPGSTVWQDACTIAALAAVVVVVDVENRECGTGNLSDPFEIVDVAAGMVAVQLGVPVDQALDRIRAHAFGSGSRICEVADAIVDYRLRLT